MDQFLTHKYSVVGSPRFGTLGVISATCRHFVDGLETDLALHFAFIFAKYYTTEIILEILADHKDNLTESGTQRIKDAIIQNGFAIRTKTIHLF